MLSEQIIALSDPEAAPRAADLEHTERMLIWTAEDRWHGVAEFLTEAP